MRLNLTGLIAAPFTPMLADGLLDLPTIDRLYAKLVADGVVGAFVCGTTGEGMSLSVAERKAVAERWRSAAPAGSAFRLIVHVGAQALPDAQELAAHGRAIGVDAIAAVSPSFNKPATADDAAAFAAAVAKAAPGVPYYHYHIPSRTNVTLPMRATLDAMRTAVPTLAGMKFTHADLGDYARCVDAFGDDLDLVAGREEMLLAFLALGARAVVGGTFNFAAQLATAVMHAAAAGDATAARRHQAGVADLVDLAARCGGLAALKAAMAVAGLDCGPPRLPLRQLQGRELTTLDEGVRRLLERVRFA